MPLFVEQLSTHFRILHNMEQQKEPDIQLEEWNPPVKEWGPVYKAIFRSFGMIWAAGKVEASVISLLMLIQGLLPALILYLSRDVIDMVIAISDSNDQSFRDVAPLLIALALATIVMQIMEPIFLLVKSILGDKMRRHVALLVMETANQHPGIAHFEDPKLHDQLQRVRQVEGSSADLVIHAFQAGSDFWALLSVALFLSLFHPLAPLLLMLCALPYALARYKYANLFGIALQFQAPEARKLDYFRNQFLSRDTAKDVRIFGLHDFFFGKYLCIFTQVLGVLWSVRGREFRILSLYALLGGAAVCVVYVILFRQTIRGELSVGELTAYASAVLLIWTNMSTSLFNFAYMSRVGGFLTHLYDFLKRKPVIKMVPKAFAKQAPRPFQKGIEFKNVSFSYPNTDRKILDGISLNIHPGETVAIVGKNGAGKTTLVKLLTRMYDPSDGDIHLDNVPIHYYNLDDLRSQMSVVDQNFLKYQLSAQENIGLGNVDRLSELEHIKAAAEEAGADFIDQLPNGYETILSRQFEGGTELSGGQWQKIALARALTRGSQLLILDEPTAALDVRSEHDLYARFQELTKQKTTVLISHRMSTVRMAERILVLDGGKVIEEGTHEELMKHNGLYARLYSLQAEHYDV